MNRIFKFAGIGVITVTMTACSMSRVLPLETEVAAASAPVADQKRRQGLDSTDAEMIKSVVARAETASSDQHALAWSNPDTGNRGTIMAIDRFVGSDGQACKKFQTTVTTFMGISIYNGETCELKRGFWVLSWFLRDGES